MFLLACAIENDKQPAGPSVSRTRLGEEREAAASGLQGEGWGGVPPWPGDGCSVMASAVMKSALTK